MEGLLDQDALKELSFILNERRKKCGRKASKGTRSPD